jgi:signal transduction histidine kinase
MGKRNFDRKSDHDYMPISPQSDLVPPDPRAIELAERRRLAQELHDAVTQPLYSLVVLGEAWRRQIEAGNLTPRLEHINELAALARQALGDVRLLIYDLQPPELTNDGLLGALHIRLELVEQRSGIETRLLLTDDHGEPLSLPTTNGRPSLNAHHLPDRVEHGLFRIAQEALNNALRHSRARLITVTFAVGDETLAMTINDDGCGFDPADPPALSAGYGLGNMRERAAALGAHCRVISAPGAGTTVQISGVSLKED